MHRSYVDYVLSGGLNLTGGVRHMPAGKLIQSPYFASGNPETEEYTALPAVGSTLPPAGSLGMVADFDQGGIAGPVNMCRYQLVKQGPGITAALGAALYWLDKTANTVTTVRTNRGLFAGVCRIAAANAASYIWILKKGRRTGLFQAAPSSAPDATGKPVVPSATTDGTFDSLANAEAQAAFPIVGVTVGVAAANLALVDWNVPDQY